MEYQSAMKRNKILIRATIQMTFQDEALRSSWMVEPVKVFASQARQPEFQPRTQAKENRKNSLYRTVLRLPHVHPAMCTLLPKYTVINKTKHDTT